MNIKKRKKLEKRIARFVSKTIPFIVIGIATCGFVTDASNGLSTLAGIDEQGMVVTSEIETEDTASLAESIAVSEAANKAAEEAKAEVETDETVETDENAEADEPEVVEPSHTVNTTSLTVWTTSSLNVRSGPSTDYEIIGYCSNGEQLEVTGVCAETGWYQITYEDGTGFVSNEYVSETYIRTYNGIKEGDVIYGSASYYCSCSICCGKSDGITASGIKAYDGIVACNWLPLGTRILIDGVEYLVADHGSSNFDVVGRLDVYTSQGHEAALEMGRDDIVITIISFPD